MVQLVPALFVAAVSIYIIVYVAKSLIQPFLRSNKGFLERRKFQSRTKSLSHAEEQIEKAQLTKALDSLKDAFFFDNIKNDPTLIKQVGRLHNEILAKLIIIARLKGQQIQRLPEFERLLEDRTKLLTISYKHKQKGKSVTKEWAGKHYADRIREVDEEVAANTKKVQQLAIEIFTSLTGESSEEDVIIH